MKGTKGMFKVTDYFSTVEQVKEILPFYFNESNSDISVCAFIDGQITVTCCFGNGKGWDTLAESIKEETEISYEWGDYTMGYAL